MSEWRVEIDVNSSESENLVTASGYENLGGLDKLNTGFKGFYFSGGDKSKNEGCWLDGSFKFFDAKNPYKGFTGKTLSSTTYPYTFAVDQIITLSNDTGNISQVIIRFDNIAGEYATKLQIGNAIYYNYSYVFSTKLPESVSSVNIKILEWSKPNSVVKILTLTTGLVLNYDTKNLKGIKFSNKVASDLSAVKFGINIQDGSISVLDKEGLLSSLNGSDLFHTGLQVKIYKDNELFQQFITDSLSANTFNTKWDITIIDDITNWEDQQFNNLSYETRTLKDILRILIPDIVFDDNVIDMTIPNSFLNTGTKWSSVQKCCQLGFLSIYKINGVIYCKRLI